MVNGQAFNTTVKKNLTKYELLNLKVGWLIILLTVINIIWSGAKWFNIEGVTASWKTGFVMFSCVYIFVLVGLNYFKGILINEGKFLEEKYFYLGRCIEVFAINLVLILNNNQPWIFLALAFPIVIASWVKGIKQGIILYTYSFIVSFSMLTINSIILDGRYSVESLLGLLYREVFIQMIFSYVSLIMFVVLGAVMNEVLNNTELKNYNLMKQLNENFERLTNAKGEIKDNYRKIMTTNAELEDSNTKLRVSLAELYTVQQIVEVISSVFDIAELFKQANDVIIGVMGVSNSTVIFYDEEKDKLKIHTSTVSDREEYAVLSDNVNCKELLKVIKSGAIYENDVSEEQYPFTKGRDINSFLCVPVIRETKKYGLVLIEHVNKGLFSDENLRFLEVIGQQVAIAIENAELYNKMHELATHDTLTGIYNRLYFQEKFQEEIKKAQEGNYELCLVIFDIDHFKTFNDTHGHLFGDFVLKSVVDIVKESLRASDVFARFGGEEFVIILPRSGISEARKKVENLRMLIETNVITEGDVSASITASFGIASYPNYGISEYELIRVADNALYKAKDKGRNCTEIASLSQAN